MATTDRRIHTGGCQQKYGWDGIQNTALQGTCDPYGTCDDIQQSSIQVIPDIWTVFLDHRQAK